MKRHPIVETIRTVVRDLFPRLEFAGDYEFRVAAQDGAFVDLKPTDAALQLPALRQIPFRGAAGIASTLQVGARVIVRFVNSDPGRPYISAVIGEDDTGHGPVAMRLVASSSVTVRAPQITLGDSDTDVAAAEAAAWVLRDGETVRVQATGAVVSGGTGSIDVVGTITLGPGLPAGPPPTGRSRVRA